MTSQTTKLRQILSERFNREELRTLCYNLNIDYDDLPGEGKAAKGSELVAYLQRRNRINDLITHLEKIRPDLESELKAIKQTPITPVERRVAALPLSSGVRIAAFVIVLIVPIVVLFALVLRPSTPATPPPTTVPIPTVPPSPTATMKPSATLTRLPTPTLTPTPSPTSTPTPESFDESHFGILVADFVRGATEKEPDQEGADLAQTAYEDLLRRIERENMSGRIAVRRIGPVRNDQEAKVIGEQLGARLVVWGYVPTDVSSAQKSFVPSFTLLASVEQLAVIDPVLFGVRISGLETLELSQQLSARVTGVSTFILSIVYLSEGELGGYEQAMRMLDLSIEGAVQELERLEEDDPRREDLEYTLSIFYATRGTACAALGDEASAYSDYQTALEYDTDSARAQYGLGNYYFSRGEFDAAYAAFEETRRLDPTLYRPYYGLAIVVYMQGDYRKAETHLKRAIELASEQDIELITAHFTLGLTYLQLAEPEQAKLEFQRVLSSQKAPQDLKDVVANYLNPIPAPQKITLVPPTLLPPGYPPPVLENVSIIACNVTFRWEFSGTLADDEWFSMRLGSISLSSVTWIKEYQFTYPLMSPGEYTWEIAICRGDPASGVCEQLAVSERGNFTFEGCPSTQLPPTQLPPTMIPPTLVTPTMTVAPFRLSRP